MDIMADEEDAMPSLFQRESEIADLLGLSGAKRRRRFVHDQDARIKMDGAGDRNRLTLASRKCADRILEAAECGLSRAMTCGSGFPSRRRRGYPAGKDLAPRKILAAASTLSASARVW